MRVLLADDEKGIQMTLGDALHDAGHHVFLADTGTEAIRLVENTRFDCVITDMRLPGADGMAVLRRVKEVAPETHVMVITGYGTIESAVEATKAGATEYIPKPFLNDDVLVRLERISEENRLREENRRLKGELTGRFQFDNLVGSSAAMKEVFERIEAVADSDHSVLITGESGTGKEMVARAIHHNSKRAQGSFEAFGCGAFAPTLIEDELFGHERGAYTDAKELRLGRFERADGGTLFLDDIDDMPPPTQIKLLRVLEERCFERLGGSQVIHVDIRVIAATKKDLGDLAGGGGFREDLYYRLNVVPIKLPPVRERLEDLPELVDHFIALHGGSGTYRVKPETYEAMAGYPWPGNVREIENAVKRAIALSTRPGLLAKKYLVPKAETTQASGQGGAGKLKRTIADAEADHILRVLNETKGNKSRAAEVLGISRKSLWKKMRDLGIDA